MSRAKRVPTATIIAALRASGGIIMTAAKKVGVDPTTLRRRIKAEPALKDAYEAISEEFVDLAESKLISLVKKGNVAAIIFTLKTKGKARGYVERQELETVGGETIHFYIPKKTPLPEDEPLATMPADPKPTEPSQQDETPEGSKDG